MVHNRAQVLVMSKATQMILVEKPLRSNTLILYMSHLVPGVAKQCLIVETSSCGMGEDEDMGSHPVLLLNNCCVASMA